MGGWEDGAEARGSCVSPWGLHFRAMARVGCPPKGEGEQASGGSSQRVVAGLQSAWECSGLDLDLAQPRILNCQVERLRAFEEEKTPTSGPEPNFPHLCQLLSLSPASWEPRDLLTSSEEG